MAQPLPIKEALSFGWKSFQAKPGLLIAAVAVMFVVESISLILNPFIERLWVLMLINAITMVLGMVVMLGIIHISLKLYRNQPATLADLWSQFKLLLPYLGANILYGLIVFGGLLLFIVPGIIWMIRYFYFSYFMVDQGLRPMAALKKSAQITHGQIWNLLLFTVLQLLIVYLGVLALGVGLLVTIPIAFMAEVYIYQFLLKNSAQ